MIGNTLTPCRPLEHLTTAGKLYPNAWKMVDELRADRGKGLPDWPEWCFLPMAGFYSIISAANGGGALSPFLIPDVAQLATLGTWRVTKGIYKFDPTLFEAIIDTPVEGNLPCEILYQLPEWAVYIEIPESRWLDDAIFGFFAFLEFDVNHGRTELRLLLDCRESLVPIPIHMGQWSLSEAIGKAMMLAKTQGIALGLSGKIPEESSEHMTCELQPLISLLLYLCSQNAEIGDGRRMPIKPSPVKTKKGLRLFTPDKATTWEVGVRLGAALRRAQSESANESGISTASHSSPIPHIRRSHWHGFRIGSRKNSDGTAIPTTDRELKLKWMPPIPVNIGDNDDLPVTVRPVK